MERVVAALERALAPSGSRVVHDQELLELDTGATRQCDVVIYSGKPPRETISIVEVQRRGRKPDLDKFRGWCSKRDKVGAQHLICVSVAGFSRTIIEDAKRQGPSVRLLTLRQLEEKDWPIQLPLCYLPLSEWIFEGSHCYVAFPEEVLATLPRVDPKLPRDQPLIETGDGGMLSLNEIAERGKLEVMSRHPPLQTEGAFERVLTFEGARGRQIFAHLFGRRLEISRIDVTYRIRMETQYLPTEFSEYEQVDFDGAAAWSFVASGEVKGHPVTVRSIFRASGDGGFHLVHEEADGFPDDFDVTRTWRPLTQEQAEEVRSFRTKLESRL